MGVNVEQTEQTTEAKIELALRQYNVADKWLDELTEKYGSHVVTPETRESDKLLLKDIGGVRRAVEAKRVFLKEESLKIGKAIDAEAKRLTKRITDVENHISAQLEKMKAEEDAAKLLKKMQAVWPQREAELIELNFQWPVGEQEVMKLKIMSDGDYLLLVNRLRAQKLEAAEAENRKLREEADARENEAKRQAELAQAQERARQEERQRIEREQAEAAERREIEIKREAEAQRQREAAEEAERQRKEAEAQAEYARKGEAEKVSLWAAELFRISPPTVNDPKLHAQVERLLDMIEGLL